jgi:hypothetical protein
MKGITWMAKITRNLIKIQKTNAELMHMAKRGSSQGRSTNNCTKLVIRLVKWEQARTKFLRVEDMNGWVYKVMMQHTRRMGVSFDMSILNRATYLLANKSLKMVCNEFFFSKKKTVCLGRFKNDG